MGPTGDQKHEELSCCGSASARLVFTDAERKLLAEKGEGGTERGFAPRYDRGDFPRNRVWLGAHEGLRATIETRHFAGGASTRTKGTVALQTEAGLIVGGSSPLEDSVSDGPAKRWKRPTLPRPW
jgi:hypothetical protein